MYAKWQVFLHTGSCVNGEKGILLSPITKVFKKIVSSLSVVWAIASCDKNCDISYVIVNTNFRVHVCQMAGILHTESYLNSEKCIYKSVQKICFILDCSLSYSQLQQGLWNFFLCNCKNQFSTLSNGKFVLVTSAYMAQTIFLGLYLFIIVNLCSIHQAFLTGFVIW